MNKFICILLIVATTPILLIAQSQSEKEYEKLKIAIGAKDFNLVTRMIAEGANVNAANKYGTTLLHIAASGTTFDPSGYPQGKYTGKLLEGSAKMAKILIDAGAKINVLDYDKKTPLMHGAETENYVITEVLLNAKAEVNHVSSNGNTALTYALINNQEETARLLLAKGANPNVKNERNQTPFTIAAERRSSVDFFNLLLEKGADINAKGPHGHTALIRLCQDYYSSLEQIKFLISKGADVNVQDDEGNTALMNFYPCYPERYPLIKHLIESKADVNIKNKAGRTILGMIECNDDSTFTTNLVNKLMEANVDINSLDTAGNTPLMLLARARNVTPALMLINAGADVNIQNNNGETALALLFNTGELQAEYQHLFLTLLKKSTNIKTLYPKFQTANTYMTPLAWACSVGNTEIVELLIQNGISINDSEGDRYSDASYPLMYAVYGQHADVVRTLIKHKVNVNVKGKAHGITPLMIAAMNGNAEIVELLLKAKADVNAKSGGGLTALMLALSSNSEEVVKILINAKSNVNAVGERRPVLHHAIAQSTSPAIIKMLIDAKADVNSIEIGGYRPIFIAINTENPEFLQLIIDAKALLNVQTDEGKTPLALAKDNGNSVIIEMIENARRASGISEASANLEASSIELISGTKQLAEASAMLKEEVVVLVKDQNGDYFEGAKVNFSVSEGMVANAELATDTNGKASVKWKLGKTLGEQTLVITAFKADGKTPLKGSPLTVKATCEVISYVTDYDGNTYKARKIGEQMWMSENLRVTRYADGSEININKPAPAIYTNNEWAALGDNNTDKAYCFYNNDPNSKYGALYTYAAATNGNTSGINVQGVCPTGWHLPNEAEWEALANALGGRNEAGGKLKEKGTTHWISQGEGVDNSSGFTALPGGYRENNFGIFSYLGENCNFWSATEINEKKAWQQYLHYNSIDIGRVSTSSKSYGFSVRCVKD
jgi:uncharacterized protein (TIGR02145 family)